MFDKGSRVRIVANDQKISYSNGKTGVVLGEGDVEFDVYGVSDLDYIVRVDCDLTALGIVRVYEQELEALDMT